MTERQAWLRMARAWAKGEPKNFCGIEPSGLCPCIDALRNAGLIDETLHLVLHERLDAYAPPMRHGATRNFRWPKGDHKARAAFCRSMAAKCKPRKRKVGVK